MLNTTALALEDHEVAELANQHLRDYAQAVIRFNNIIPAAVVRFLQEEGLPARLEVLQQVSRNVMEAWRLGEAEAEATRPRNTRSTVA